MRDLFRIMEVEETISHSLDMYRDSVMRIEPLKNHCNCLLRIACRAARLAPAFR